MRNVSVSLKGSVIIEVLVAAVIFMVAIIGLINFQGNLMRERAIINQESKALSLAQDKMQYFRNYTTLTTTPGYFAYQDIANGSSNIVDADTTYAMQWTVTNHTGSDLPLRKDIAITVTWTDSANTSHTVTINSIIVSIDPTGSGKVSEMLP